MKRAAFLGGTLFGCVLGLALVARASLGGVTGVVIPYQGHLDLNGTPVTAMVTMGFDIYNGVNGTPSITPCYVFNPSGPILVAGGQFTVLITGVPEVCVKASEVYLGTRVTQAPDPEVALAGRQRIHPAVGAYTSGGGDFYSTGEVTASAVTAPTVTTTNIGVSGAASFGAATRQMINLYTAEYGIGVQGATQYFRTGGGYAFFRGGSHSNGTNDPGGGARLMTLDVVGNLDVANRVLRNEHELTCVEGNSGINFGYCCRMQVRTGETHCRVATNSTWGGWTVAAAPFSAASEGPYSLSCSTWIGGVNFATCCRTDAAGNVACVYNNSNQLTSAWIGTAAPF
jgi:hypothetical protein